MTIGGEGPHAQLKGGDFGTATAQLVRELWMISQTGVSAQYKRCWLLFFAAAAAFLTFPFFLDARKRFS